MDLFGDLPAPSTASKLMDAKHNVSTKSPQPLISPKSVGLFGDLPETSTTENKNSDKNDNPLKRKSGAENGANVDETVIKKPVIELLELLGHYAERQGEREDMQDAHVIIDNFTSQVEDLHQSVCRLAYYAVFDGHAGARASKFSAVHLHKTMAEKFPKGDLSKVETDIKRCLVETYKKTDEDFLKQASKSKPSWKDGTTATTVLVINNTVYIANLGDSKALLCRYNTSEDKYQAIPLTKDHNPLDFNERMRIQKAGGQVKDGRVMGVLEVSRSIGDGPYKNHGVTCVPDIKRCQLTANDRWILIACDGLWKTFTNDLALKFTNQILQDESIEGTELKSAEEMRWDTACQRLASEAVRRLSADNVTVVLVKISKKNTDS